MISGGFIFEFTYRKLKFIPIFDLLLYTKKN